MTIHVPDLTGVVVGTYRGIEKTEHRDAYRSTLWLFRCTCEGCKRTKLFSAGEVTRYQRNGTTPRCYCKGYRAFIAERGVVHARRCGLCKSVDHAVADCPQRTPARWCGKCAGLAHRVVGIKCRECGLRYCAEPPVELTLPSGSSPGARCLEFAIGSDKDDNTHRRRQGRAA